jgi:hypothetical protein
MSLPIPPWRNIIVRYCPRCRLVYPRGTDRCSRCQEPLVDQVRREPVEER